MEPFAQTALIQEKLRELERSIAGAAATEVEQKLRGWEETQRATLNILEDFDTEKRRLEDSQRALLNILDDFEAEKAKVVVANLSLAAANEEIRAFNHELEARVGERTASLAASNRELEAFTYSVAHDLRTPLRHMHGFISLLAEDYAPTFDEQGRTYLAHVVKGAEQMGHLIDDLLNLSRVGRQQLVPQVVGLGRLVAEIQEQLGSDVGERRVRWQVANELPFVECDAALMRQVLQNLLANAVKFTGPRAEAVIEVGVRPLSNGEVTVFVRDNGVGFSMKHADKLFGVFQRLHRQEDFEGTGVGLATVQRIVQKHGGRVWAEAELDHGATFYFTLPTPAQAPLPVAAPAEAPAEAPVPQPTHLTPAPEREQAYAAHRS
jgi:light-regulated signal transduction histidine kinase (bacteriophytochrome)